MRDKYCIKLLTVIGSTGVACINTGREFIGFELDKKYFEIAEQRLKDAVFSMQQQNLFETR